jgi:thioredoxin-related protein
MQTQEVAKAYGAVCTPDFYLFKKVHPFAWHILSMEGYLTYEFG